MWLQRWANQLLDGDMRSVYDEGLSHFAYYFYAGPNGVPLKLVQRSDFDSRLVGCGVGGYTCIT